MVPTRPSKNSRPSKQRILVVDASDRLRDDIRAFLDNSGLCEVVGDAATLEQAIQLARTTHPEVALVDVEMAEGEGLDVLQTLRACLPVSSLVIATYFDNEEYGLATAAAGAAVSIPKTRLFDSLLPALEAAVESARLARGNGGHQPFNNGPGTPHGKRSDRESYALAAGPWWRPRSWREWLAGAAAFGWALIRGAPVDSSPPTSYWRYVEAGMALLISLLLIGYFAGELDNIGDLSKGTIVLTLLALIAAQFRQIRRLAMIKRAAEVERRAQPVRPTSHLHITTNQRKGGENR